MSWVNTRPVSVGECEGIQQRSYPADMPRYRQGRISPTYCAGGLSSTSVQKMASN